MPIDVLAFANGYFVQLALFTQIDGWEIHHFCHTGDPFIGDHQFQILSADPSGRGFERRSRDTTRQHDEKIHRQMLAGFQNVADAIQAQHIGVFMRVDHHSARPVWHDCPSKLNRGQQRALEVEMGVNQTWRQVSATQIDLLLAAVFSDTHDPSVLYGNIRPVYFSAQDIDQSRILKHHLGRLFTASNAEFSPDVAHNSV
jgi:hypothetical protein